MSTTNLDTTPGVDGTLSAGALLRALWCACRIWAGRAAWLVILANLTLVLLVKFRAESNLLTAFLAYLPAWVVVLPLVGAMLLGILFACWRATAFAVLLAVIAVPWLGGYSMSGKASSQKKYEGESLTVMTYNRGQGASDVLAAFATATAPDIAVFQDAARRLPQFAAQPHFVSHTFNHQHGEFALLSRWPLLENKPLNLFWPEKAAGVFLAGIRSVIDWNGRRVVVYNIHFPTPRDLLYWYAKRGTFLYGLLGIIPGTFLHERHQQYLATWAARVGLASQLAARIHQESDPVILMGDLNFPPAGQAYHLLCKTLQDAHVAAGSGFGHTFPGNMQSLGRFISPWVRIDHVLTSRHWEVLSCQVAAPGHSQHLPVGAKFKLY
jgi:endonuclease/exonuclease/phosphatase (EEP) superfamily protein YafD